MPPHWSGYGPVRVGCGGCLRSGFEGETRLTPSGPHGDASLLQGAPNRAGRHAQMRSHPICRPTLGIELRGTTHVFFLERPALPLRDAVAPDVAEDRRPIDPERRRQLLDGDTLAVGVDQCAHLDWSKAPLDRERGDDRVGRVRRSLAGVLAQHRPERWQAQHRAIYLGKRTRSCSRMSSRTVTR